MNSNKISITRKLHIFVLLVCCLMLVFPSQASLHTQPVVADSQQITTEHSTQEFQVPDQPVSDDRSHLSRLEMSRSGSEQVEAVQSQSTPLPNVDENAEPIMMPESYSPPSPKIRTDATYVSHAPISINGDSQFGTVATNEGWSGDGSMGNPYIITGYNISGVSDIPIFIVNTAVYFTIQDNVIRDSLGQGLFLQNVDNAKVVQNIIFNSTYNGMYLRNVANSNIQSNIIMNSSQSGIYLFDGAQDNILNNNTIYNSISHGLFLASVGTGNEITNNTAYDNDGYGAYLRYSPGLLIDDNNFSFNLYYGLYLYQSNSSQVTNNQVHENGNNGIYLVYTSGNTVSDNYISKNNDGIQTRFTDTALITNNHIYNNRLSGIAILSESNLVDLEGNEVYNNTQNGLYFHTMTSSTATNNELYDNGDCGMQLILSTDNVVTYNNFTNNDGYGMKLTRAGDNTIKHNIFTEDGFYVQGNEHADYIQTSFTNNTADGLPIVMIQGSLSGIPSSFAQLILLDLADETISGYSLSNRETPLIIAFSERLVISGNAFSNNFAHGLTIGHVNDSIVENNVLSYNRKTGLLMDQFGYNNVIRSNVISDNDDRGLYLIDNQFTEVYDNEVSANKGTNIAVARSHGCSVHDNTASASENGRGIAFDTSENSTIANNELFDNDYGIYVFGPSHNTTITSNLVYDNSYSGIYLRDSENSTLEQNTAYNNSFYGLLVNNAFRVLVDGNTAYENGYHGIYIASTGNATIVDNQAYENIHNGIALITSTYCELASNLSHDNGWDGISLYTSSSNNWIHDNTLRRNTFKGIYLEGSGNNIVSYNVIEHNDQHGLILAESSQNTILYNTFVDDGLYIQGSSLANLLQDEVANNTVNGKALVYIQQKHDGSRISGAGQVVIIDSSYVVVDGNEFANTTTGALVRFSSHISIRNNLFANNSHYAVILVQDTTQSIVVGNNFISNRINSTSQAYDDGTDNLFAYNYWDTGSDVDVDDDGISEVPYMIFGSANNRDNTPLVRPYSAQSNSIEDPTIISPNGGEVLNGTVTVKWTQVPSFAEETIRYDLYYSSDGGISFTPIAQGIIGASSYTWNTQLVENSEDFLVKVVAINMHSGLSSDDLSDGSFSVHNTNSGFFDDLPPEYLYGGAGILAALLAILGGGMLIRRRIRGR